MFGFRFMRKFEQDRKTEVEVMENNAGLKMATRTNQRHSSCSNSAIPERRKRANKRAFDWALVLLRVEHFLFRIRSPKISRLQGTLLLLLDPVGYEMLPKIRTDKGEGFRRKIARHLAYRLCREPISELLQFPQISKADSEKMLENLRRPFGERVRLTNAQCHPEFKGVHLWPLQEPVSRPK